MQARKQTFNLHVNLPPSSLQNLLILKLQVPQYLEPPKIRQNQVKISNRENLLIARHGMAVRPLPLMSWSWTFKAMFKYRLFVFPSSWRDFRKSYSIIIDELKMPNDSDDQINA